MKPADLENEFSKFGKVKSAKISLNKNHESNEYGFVCFEDSKSSEVAVSKTKSNDTL